MGSKTGPHRFHRKSQKSVKPVENRSKFEFQIQQVQKPISTGKPIENTDKPVDFVDKSDDLNDKSMKTRTSGERGSDLMRSSSRA
jgi:hypothetical protein